MTTIQALIDELPDIAARHCQVHGRPLVTLTYAQSLDGSITPGKGKPLDISGGQSLMMTHRLRAAHQAILVGIGTVLADDPQLTTRRVVGEDPQPVVLDSHLRMPEQARLLDHPNAPWLMTALEVPAERQAVLKARGARLFAVPAAPQGGLDLNVVLDHLCQTGIKSIMVEGGGRVITSFLSQALVDLVVLTIAPVFMGGVKAVDALLAPGLDVQISDFPRIQDLEVMKLGKDLVVWGWLNKT